MILRSCSGTHSYFEGQNQWRPALPTRLRDGNVTKNLTNLSAHGLLGSLHTRRGLVPHRDFVSFVESFPCLCLERALVLNRFWP